MNDFGDPNRSADRKSVLVSNVLCQAAGMAEIVVKRIIGLALELHSMQIVGSRFDADVDGRTAGRALLCIERIGADADGVDSFRRRQIRYIDRQPGVGVGRANQPGVVGLRGNAVLRYRDGALGGLAAELASPVPAVVLAPGCSSNRAWKFLPSVPLYGRLSISCGVISAWTSALSDWSTTASAETCSESVM
jgi:hypothetical protein